MTPEGRVKAKLNRVIKRFPDVYKFMSVPSGFGPSTLDYTLCVNSFYIGIETKAPGKHPTPRQIGMMSDIRRAGGIVLVIDNTDDAEHVGVLLKLLSNATRPSQH
ncbi:hypothetical protein [Pseudolabrys sp.]|uniref:hypothetical protein n=1 Tax=Pseudolabrys sp. TaxID=1960880 RepID=UPI003D120620